MSAIGQASVNVDKSNELAQNAQDTADSGVAGVGDINSANKLTPSEKLKLSQEYQVYQSEYTNDLKLLNDVGLSTKDLDAAMTNIKNFLTPYFANMTTTDTVDRDALNSVIKAFTDAEHNVIGQYTSFIDGKADDAIKGSQDANAKADTAVDNANKAVSDAGFANQTANDAKSSAADAIDQANEAKNNAENALKNSSDALADAANAINTANNSDAKASQAQKDANAATGKAEDAISAANKAQGDATSALGNSNAAISNAQDALNKYNNLSFGGRNLFIGTTDQIKTKTGGGCNIDYIGYYDKPAVGQKYTISVEITDTDHNMLLQVFRGKADKSRIDTIAPNQVITTATKVYVTFVWPDPGATGAIQIMANLAWTNGTDTGSYSYRKAKLETGNVPTDWTPAFEDIQVQIDNVNGELSQKVSQTDYDNLQGTVTSQGTQITQTVNDLKSKADKTVVDTINQTVKDQATEIDQNSHDIQLKADSSVVNEIKGTVDSNSAAIKLANDQIDLKANQSQVDTINKTVQQNTANIGVNANAIKLKADSSTVDGLAGRVTKAEGELTVQAGQIAQTVSKTELDNTLGKYATQTWTQGQIKTTADNINLSVQKVQSNLDSIDIGGRNYLLNSRTFEFHYGINNSATVTIEDYDQTTKMAHIIIPERTSAVDGIYFKANDVLEAGTNWGLSADMKGVGTASRFWLENSTSVSEAGWKLTENWVRYFATGISAKENHNFVIYFDASKETVDVYIKLIKVDKSNKVTDWSPAPEDMASEVEFSQLQITVDGIQGTVAGKADQSQVTQLAGQITSVVSSLNSPNLISEDGWTASNGGVIEQRSHAFYTGTHTLYRLGNTKASEVFAYPKDMMKLKPNTKYTLKFIGFAGSNVTGMDAWILGKSSDGKTSQNVQAVSNRKLSPTEAEVVTATFTTGNVTTSGQLRFDNNGSSNAPEEASLYFAEVQIVEGTTAGVYQTAESQVQSQITQLKDDINLRVQKGDVINQINISPESILIAGQKVHITGQTTIDNAVIKDAMIANISASKMTTGTLDAAKINVININASNITAGKLNAIDITGGTITGATITSTKTDSTGTKSVTIDNGGITGTTTITDGSMNWAADFKIADGISGTTGANGGKFSYNSSGVDVDYFVNGNESYHTTLQNTLHIQDYDDSANKGSVDLSYKGLSINSMSGSNSWSASISNGELSLDGPAGYEFQGSGKISGRDLKMYNQVGTSLWSGVKRMYAVDTITPKTPLSQCLTGWELLWSRYDTKNLLPMDQRFFIQRIPKWFASSYATKGMTMVIDGPASTTANTSDSATKYIYIDDMTIRGYGGNEVGESLNYCLREVRAY